MPNLHPQAFLAERLGLPLFLASRNRIKSNYADKMCNYMRSKRNLYTHTCHEENLKETKDHKKVLHAVGLDKTPKEKCSFGRRVKFSPDLMTSRPWQLPPNIYNVPTKLFEKHKGMSGAFWSKFDKDAKPAYRKGALSRLRKPQFKFYELQSNMESMQFKCQKHKGIFLSNARDRKPTSRMMTCDPQCCYRNPKDPGAASYYSKIHETTYNVSEIKTTPRPNPHVFLTQSCVPLTANVIHRKHISFEPGPGRYETRYRDLCRCSSKRIYMPNIDLIVEREKRFKFRRMPYVKINIKRYCSPNWMHIAGRGHRYLFKNIPAPDPKLAKFKAKKTDTRYQLFPDARYIHMITEPMRKTFTFRSDASYAVLEREVKIRYNCMARVIVRRAMRNNKRICFLSGQERWKDSDRPMPLTAQRLEQIKASLPPERVLRDRPVMHTPLANIKTKVWETPEHMKPAYELELRKRLFKFPPLPAPKVLVSEDDPRLKPTLRGGFYNTELNVLDYFRKEPK